MSSGADLFVVCKQCGSEVSPYVTECPYCGNRLRRRAPKLPRVGDEATEKPGRRGLGRLLARSRTRDSTLGSRRAASTAQSRWAHVRPQATIALVAASCVMYVVTAAEPELYLRMPIIGPLDGSWWKLLTYQFCYLPGDTGVYALVAIVATGLFGWLVEQRHGPAAVLATFLGGGVTGGLVALAVYPLPIASGADAGALALLGAWVLPDLRAARAATYWEGDLLGAAAFAALLLAIPFAATPAASWLAGVVGGLFGLAAGQAFFAVSREGTGGDL